jgi:3',5'-cyclic-AMP phosphodiesterase
MFLAAMFLVRINMIKPILKDGTVKIIQISDTHLFSDDEQAIFGVKSNLTFKEVMEKMIAKESQDTDMIFLTGDMSQDETIESYQKIADPLSKLNIPIYWIPGNHDDLTQIEAVFQNAKNFNRDTHLSLPDWHLIFLNTKMEGVDEGYLSQSELTILSNELIASPPDKKIAIVMHHHPAPVGTPLIDYTILKNTKEFWNIVTETKVELIICGHVHGDYQFKYKNIMIESSPATCLQWEKGSKELKTDLKIGYKIYYFVPIYNPSNKRDRSAII